MISIWYIGKDMSDENNFCVACGARLPADAEFCPECGAGIGGRANPHNIVSGQYSRPMSNGVSMIGIFILIYGIFAIIISIMGLYFGLTMTEEKYQSMVDLYESMGIGVPFEWSDSLNAEMLRSGGLSLASGISALVSFWFCYQKGPKKYALVACAAATVLSYAVLGILSVAIGVIVTFMLYNDKKSFTS